MTLKRYFEVVEVKPGDEGRPSEEAPGLDGEA